MPEGLKTTDGKPVAVAPAGASGTSSPVAFDKAMAAPIEDYPAAPDKPVAEKPEGSSRRRAPRTPKQEAKPNKPAKPAPVIKDDYSEDAKALVQVSWAVMASIPQAAPYALPLANNADAWTAGLAEGAKHNSTIRAMVSSGGGNSWALTLAAAAAQTGMQVWAVMNDPELRKEAREITAKQLKAFMLAQGAELPEVKAEEAPSADQGV